MFAFRPLRDLLIPTQLNTEFINNDSYTYYYDSVGNITSVRKGERTSTDPTSGDFIRVKDAVDYRSYEYDDLYQLTRENNKSTNETKVWAYDTLGNIKSVTIYPYSTSTLSTATKTVTYDYGEKTDTTTDDDGTGWNNILLGVDLDGNGSYEASETITYDAIGNPTKYLGNDLLWTGRELYRYQNNDFRNTYYYDSEGLRSRKNIYVSNGNGGYTYNGKIVYQYLGGLLTYQCTYNASDEVDTEMYFFYDSYDKLTAIRYIKGTTNHYYYVTTNMYGDVLGIYSASAVLLASYDYDAWGNCTVTYANPDYTIAYDNPIRYRSYYYDTETGFYYVSSRYYDPEIGRFINADSQLNQKDGILGYNMFAYCHNNPIMYSDPTGHSITLACIIIGAVIGAVAGGCAGAYVSKKQTGKVNGWAVAAGAVAGGVVGGLVGWGVGAAITAVGTAATGSAATAAAPVVQQAVEKASSSAETASTTVYRSISQAEAISIQTMNKFSLAQGAMECKQFGFSLSETIEFGSKYGQNLIAKATVPNSMISQLYTGGVGGIDTPIFKSGTLTVPYEMLEAFNEAVAGTIQIMP